MKGAEWHGRHVKSNAPRRGLAVARCPHGGCRESGPVASGEVAVPPGAGLVEADDLHGPAAPGAPYTSHPVVIGERH